VRRTGTFFTAKLAMSTGVSSPLHWAIHHLSRTATAHSPESGSRLAAREGSPSKTYDSSSLQRSSETDETLITQILVEQVKLSGLRFGLGLYRLCVGDDVLLDKLDDSVRGRLYELDLSLITDCIFPTDFVGNARS
jgi:hypothetical protein